MSAVKHTPGPWQMLPEEMDKPYIRIRGTALGGRYKIANVLGVVYEGAPEWEAVETRANARLIAVCPTMFDALELIAAHDPETCNGLTPRDCVDAMREIARAALAKVRGQ